jgi:hypothetical protein
MSAINWQATCCGHHGEYAEHPLKAGGVARLKRTPGVDTWQVCRFGPDNRAIDKDADGVPAYVEMAKAVVVKLLV